MTMHRYRRCLNCQDVYTYQTSGRGAPKYNNNDYCPTCQEAIVNALKTVPQKFDCKRVPVAETPYAAVTREEIEAWYEAEQAARIARRKTEPNNFWLWGQQVWGGYLDLQTGDSQDVIKVKAPDGPYHGVSFWLSVWKKSKEYTIEVDMERDILTDRIVGPWKEYSRTS